MCFLCVRVTYIFFFVCACVLQTSQCALQSFGEDLGCLDKAWTIVFSLFCGFKEDKKKKNQQMQGCVNCDSPIMKKNI